MLIELLLEKSKWQVFKSLGVHCGKPPNKKKDSQIHPGYFIV